MGTIAAYVGLGMVVASLAAVVVVAFVCDISCKRRVSALAIGAAITTLAPAVWPLGIALAAAKLVRAPAVVEAVTRAVSPSCFL